jgi:hypothetical protein
VCATGLDILEDLGEFFEEGAGFIGEGEGCFLFDCEVEGVEDCGEILFLGSWCRCSYPPR